MNSWLRQLSTTGIPMIIAVAAACGSDRRAHDDAVNVDRIATFVEAIAAAVAAAGDDCGKIADGVEAVFRQREAEMKSLRAWFDETGRDEARTVRIGQALAPRMAAIRPQLESIVRCGDDPRMRAVETRMKALMKPGGK